MHLHSSPAYSISGGHKPRVIEEKRDVPGPGAYTVEKIPYQTHNPSWKMGTDKRDHDVKNLTPGPGSYDARGYASETPAVTLKARSKDHKPEAIPGPGAYDPRFDRVIKQDPSFKLGHGKKLNSIQANTYTPGPGAYNSAVDSISRQGIKIGSQKRLGFEIKKQIPGPGSYYDQKLVKSHDGHQPMYSFGKSQRNNDYEKKVPGPGQYDYKGEIQTQSALKKGFSMSVRKRQTIETNNAAPGPGAYDLTHSSYKSLKNAPSYSMGHSAKSSLAQLTTPGPLDYNVKDELTRKKMSFVIGKQKRQTLDIRRKASIPGPGSYNKKDILGSDGPKYSITTTKHSTKMSDIPGPGAYEPTLITPKDGYTVIGREKRGSDPKGNIVGPGQYDPFAHEAKQKGFTIGHDKRDNSKEKLTPGPGQYDLPSTIANLPRYNQSSSKH